jgi:hypothetical protein
VGKNDQAYAVNTVNDVTYPALDERECMNRGEHEVSNVTQLSKPQFYMTTDGLPAFRAEFEGPDPKHVRRPRDLQVQVSRVIDDAAAGQSILVDDDHGVSIETRFDAKKRVWIVSWFPHLADVKCDGSTFEFVVGRIDEGATLRREFKCTVKRGSREAKP